MRDFGVGQGTTTVDQLELDRQMKRQRDDVEKWVEDKLNVLDRRVERLDSGSSTR